MGSTDFTKLLFLLSIAQRLEWRGQTQKDGGSNPVKWNSQPMSRKQTGSTFCRSSTILLVANCSGPTIVRTKPLLSIVVHCCPSLSIVVNLRLDLPWSTNTIDWWYIVKIPYPLIYFECTGTGTDGTFTGTDDTGVSFDGTGTGNEGTDSTSTDAYDIGTILSHFHWWILRLSAIPKKSTHSLTHSLTDSLNNIGLRDASASKNVQLGFRLWKGKSHWNFLFFIWALPKLQLDRPPPFFWKENLMPPIFHCHNSICSSHVYTGFPASKL